MINKITLQSLISKYYLGINESVKWSIKNNTLSIDFMSPTKDVIGNVTCNEFNLEDCDLAIYDTKKLTNLISICKGDLLLEPEKINKLYTKLKISDSSFNLTYALSDPLLINKVGTVNVPQWAVKLELSSEDVDSLIKAKSALSEVDNMLITTIKNNYGESVCEFVFGDESGHNNKITYQISGDIQELNIKLPFNSNIFKTILQVNKTSENYTLYLSNMGLMKLEFQEGPVSNHYYIVRKAEQGF